MATATFRLTGLTPTELIEKVRSVIGKMVANILVYATPSPTVIEMGDQADALETSVQGAESGDRFKKAQARLDYKQLMFMMSLWQAYVQTTSAGDATKILLVADLKKGRTSTGILPAPGNIRTHFGYDAGEIRLLFGGVRGRAFYRVQINPTPADNSTWADYTQTTKPRVIVKGLLSGREYAIRVNTVSADGTGEWSDVIMQKAL